MSSIPSPNEVHIDLLTQASAVMTEFKRIFGKSLSADVIAEIYAAQRFGLKLCDEQNQIGYDAISPEGIRYQVKRRAVGTQNVDIRNFEFDYLILINLDDRYQLQGMWRITVAQTQAISIYQEKYLKYQTTQKQIKEIGEQIV